MMQVETKALVSALEIAGRAVQRRSRVPVLEQVRLRANGVLAVEASDLDTSLRVELPYSGEAVDLTIPGDAQLRAGLKLAGGETVRIARRDPGESGEKGQLRTVIESIGALGPMRAEVMAYPADDHPGAERTGPHEFSVELGADALRALHRVTPAISSEETRYYLNGVCVSKVGDWLYQFVATDGRRLFIADVPLPGAEGVLPDRTIIPKAALKTMLDLFRKSPGPVVLRYARKVDGNAMPHDLAEAPRGAPRLTVAGTVRGLPVVLTSKEIDGTYPDYTRVIPAVTQGRVRIKRQALVDAVRAVVAIASGSGKVMAVKLVFAPDGQVQVTRQSAIAGDAAVEIPAEHDLPDGTFVGVNGNYLLDALAAFTGEDVVLESGGEFAGSPMIISDPTDTAFRVVQMPMRV